MRMRGLGLAQTLAEAGEPQAAIENFSKVLETRPDPQAQYGIALALVVQGHRETAVGIPRSPCA